MPAAPVKERAGENKLLQVFSEILLDYPGALAVNLATTSFLTLAPVSPPAGDMAFNFLLR